MRNIKRRGLMLILSSPSGAGKTTLANLLLQTDRHIHTSISATTRKKRPKEIDGQHYHFVTKEQFNTMVENDELLEYAEVFNNYYGTPRKLVEKYLENGEDVLFDIDWQGNRQLTNLARKDVVSVFILPPSKQELLARLKSRSQDDDKIIEYRMQRADSEISHWAEYDYTIINKDIDDSIQKLIYILKAERLKKARRTGLPDFAQSLINEK